MGMTIHHSGDHQFELSGYSSLCGGLKMLDVPLFIHREVNIFEKDLSVKKSLCLVGSGIQDNLRDDISEPRNAITSCKALRVLFQPSPGN